MSSYCAISPTSSAPWLRRRATTSSAVAVRGPHHGEVGTDVVESDDAVHPTPLVRRLAFELHTELGEERFGSLEVVDDGRESII
jgi:hypothetical protein